MDKIGIYLNAFNAEKTLERMLESIINQTYKNFEIYLSDNGSTDSTFEIVRAYSKKYDFIHCYRRKNNFAGSFMSALYAFASNEDYSEIMYYKYGDDDTPISYICQFPEWVCFVDSDDTLEPTYLEDMLFYAKENSLDMVMCGWNFVRPDRVDCRVANVDEVIVKKQYAEKLSYYDKFMGPIWNKLFRVSSMAKNILYYENKYARLFKDGVYFYGADTAYNYFYLGNNSDKFGIVAKPLYNYMIYDESVSRKRFNPMRIVADRRLAEVRYDFLQEIGENISEENREFITNIYFKSSKDTMNLLMNDERYDLKEKMRYLHEMYDCELMREAFPIKEKKYL